jgi:hypothetical protein
MRPLAALPLVTLLIATSFSAPSAAQVADPAAQKRAADPLAKESERMLDERSLRPAVYNGVKFLALVAQGKMVQADGVFLTRGRTRQSLQEGYAVDALRLLDLKPPFSIQCVGFNAMSLDALTIAYIATTEDGPIGVKLYIYKHENNVYVGRVDIADDWTKLELMTDSLLRLPAPLVINVTASRDDNGSGEVEGGGK